MEKSYWFSALLDVLEYSRYGSYKKFHDASLVKKNQNDKLKGKEIIEEKYGEAHSFFHICYDDKENFCENVFA